MVKRFDVTKAPALLNLCIFVTLLQVFYRSPRDRKSIAGLGIFVLFALCEERLARMIAHYKYVFREIRKEGKRTREKNSQHHQRVSIVQSSLLISQINIINIGNTLLLIVTANYIYINFHLYVFSWCKQT